MQHIFKLVPTFPSHVLFEIICCPNTEMYKQVVGYTLLDVNLKLTQGVMVESHNLVDFISNSTIHNLLSFSSDFCLSPIWKGF